MRLLWTAKKEEKPLNPRDLERGPSTSIIALPIGSALLGEESSKGVRLIDAELKSNVHSWGELAQQFELLAEVI